MTQAIITDKFITYLSIKEEELNSYYQSLSDTKPDQPQELQKKKLMLKQTKERLAELKKLQDDFIQKGHCFGFALCYSSMAFLGEPTLAWWESALCTIAEWDGKKNTLMTAIKTLPTLPYTESKETNLDTLITKGINYIKLNHADLAETANRVVELKDEQGKDYDQRSMLRPNAGIFELLANDGKTIKKIAHAQTVAGCFSDEHLDRLLEEKTIDGFICILGDFTILNTSIR